jgi:hypothetical protein
MTAAERRIRVLRRTRHDGHCRIAFEYPGGFPAGHSLHRIAPQQAHAEIVQVLRHVRGDLGRPKRIPFPFSAKHFLERTIEGHAT